MEFKFLKKYEPDFTLFLLNGIADDKLDIGPQCIQFLEEHGKRMQDAIKALGDDEEIKGLHEQPETEIHKEKMPSLNNVRNIAEIDDLMK